MLNVFFIVFLVLDDLKKGLLKNYRFVFWFNDGNNLFEKINVMSIWYRNKVN